jgi:hypothetical protein
MGELWPATSREAFLVLGPLLMVTNSLACCSAHKWPVNGNNQAAMAVVGC